VVPSSSSGVPPRSISSINHPEAALPLDHALERLAPSEPDAETSPPPSPKLDAASASPESSLPETTSLTALSSSSDIKVSPTSNLEVPVLPSPPAEEKSTP